MSSFAAPLHFVTTFLLVVGAFACVWLAASRPELAPRGWARFVFGVGWALLGVAETLHGGQFITADSQTGVLALRTVAYFLLLISLLMVLGRGLTQICIALGVTTWVQLCRLIRGETLRHREREYVRAARALGVSPFSIMFRHILPNLFHIVIIAVTLSLSGLILYEVTLTYLGLGLEPGAGSWGAMIDAARLELAREPVIWWNLVAASVAVFILVLALNLFGDALRDALDPRLRGLEGAAKNG